MHVWHASGFPFEVHVTIICNQHGVLRDQIVEVTLVFCAGGSPFEEELVTEVPGLVQTLGPMVKTLKLCIMTKTEKGDPPDKNKSPQHRRCGMQVDLPLTRTL
jgi:hypothetical protein